MLIVGVALSLSQFISSYLQWNGNTCNKDEKFKAVQYLQTIKAERNGKPKVEVLEERDMSPNHKFYSNLRDGTAEKEPEEVGICCEARY